MGPEGTRRDPASQSEVERRAAPRQSSTLRITCYPVNASLMERRQARLRNISRTGVGFIVDRSWPPGSAIMLELPFEEGVKAVKAKVIHSTAQIAGTYLVGCALEMSLTDAEVQELSR